MSLMGGTYGGWHAPMTGRASFRWAVCVVVARDLSSPLSLGFTHLSCRPRGRGGPAYAGVVSPSSQVVL